ncbi:DUF1643 domain-containing protein [Scytonema millei VB511283]|uniref:DUF1643 domain-containing protein n=2 Tax=Scytonema TaxID=1203 RepID=A0A9X5I5L7_9CYAN|nr:DUF1643 domain-containing protein [Scytonema millei VB511283]
MKMSAAIAPDGLYRYSLTRVWETDLPCIGFIMLNPSTADATKDDPTIRRCINFARNWGYGGIEVGNLFAYRATDWLVLRRVFDPVGCENDSYLMRMQQSVEKIVIAWGNYGSWQQRDKSVLGLLSQGRVLYCLGVTLQGQPRHPLYVRGGAVLIPYRESGVVGAGFMKNSCEQLEDLQLNAPVRESGEES